MAWGVLFIVTAGVVVWLIDRYRRDRRRERVRVRDVLSPTMAAEVERERQAALARKERFAEALKQAEAEQRK